VLPDRWASAHVDVDTVMVDVPGSGAWVADLPLELEAWIGAFDKGQPVQPGSFTVTGWRPDEEDEDGDEEGEDDA
jgi:hypothetical protein